MKTEEFRKKWVEVEDNLNPIELKNLEGLNLTKNSIEFLNQSGLPDEASPYLSFVKNSEDIYESVQKLTTLYDFLDDKFDKYIVIGSCSDGDFIVINTLNNDMIECLDHDNYFEAESFNSNINRTGECLLIYREFISDLIQKYGEDGYLNSKFTDEEFEKLKNDLSHADPDVMTTNGFWAKQLQIELSIRDENSKKSI